MLLIGEAGNLIVAHVWMLYKGGRPWSQDELDVGNWLAAAYGYTFFWLLVATGIALMSWMYRTHKELRRLGRGKLRFPSMMAVFGWIVPYWCFIRPFEVMREIFAASHDESIHIFRPVVGAWWGFFLAATAVACSK